MMRRSRSPVRCPVNSASDDVASIASRHLPAGFSWQQAAALAARFRPLRSRPESGPRQEATTRARSVFSHWRTRPQICASVDF